MTKLSASVLAIALTLLAGLLGHQFAEATSGSQQNGAYVQRPDSNGRPQLMVAIYCGGFEANGKSPRTLYHNQYLDVESRKWRSDRDTSAFCTQDRQAILKYCQKTYPDHDVRNIVESSRPYKIDNWCKIGTTSKRRCRTKLVVKPYRCLEGTFQSDALLVPERCLFDHVHNKSVCEISDHWNKAAVSSCQGKGMKLQSYAMLQPCGVGVFSGVEFVCCPSTTPSSNLQPQQVSASSESNNNNKNNNKDEGNSFAQAANTSPKVDSTDEKLNDIKVDGTVVKKHHEQESDNDEDSSAESGDSSESDDDDEEYEDDEDEYDDDSSSWNSDKSSTGSSSSTTTTTTTTTTTERPVDHYLSHFDLAHEHDEFRRAELAVEVSYKEKITHVMSEWGQLNNRYEEMKKKDPQAADEYKKKMTHHFQKVIESLEEEATAARHQLASMHAERAMAIINRRKKAAMDCLTQSLDRMPIRSRHVERCIVRLLKALEKDRTHTLRQYKNLLNLDTRQALKEKKIILDHLVTLNRAANQSIAMLDRSPILVEKLKGKIVAYWHKLRNIPLDEQIARDSELKIMEKYEEEVAQRKIEQERQRMPDQQEVSGSAEEPASRGDSAKVVNNNNINNNVNNNKETSSVQVVEENDKPAVGSSATMASNQMKTTTTSTTIKPEKIDDIIGSPQPLVLQAPSEVQLKQQTDETHYHIDSARFSHLKSDSPIHELSYSVKHDPLDEHMMKFGYSTLLVSACAVVFVVALIGIKYYSTHSNRAYRRQGFAEVGRSCPEEKSVANMQFNGYENPAYKFFEAEA